VRKRYRSKRRACGLCKPNKAGRGIRWRYDEFVDRRQWEREQKLLMAIEKADAILQATTRKGAFGW
jgi:hypothetical protein